MADETKPEQEALADSGQEKPATENAQVAEKPAETVPPANEPPKTETPPEEPKTDLKTEETAPATEDVVFKVDETLMKAKVSQLNDLDDYLTIKLHKKATLILIGLIFVGGLMLMWF